MINQIRWGVLSTAKIGREKVIPAIQKSTYAKVLAIGSRNIEKANETAKLLDIAKAYGSYEEVLDDNEVDAIYIPLPNHLHIEWTIKALQAGKHVLFEKPIGLSSSEAETLLKVSQEYPRLRVMEAFMYRFHPQWQCAKGLIEQKKIGELKVIESFYSYHNIDPNNIRNKKELGGGGLMDIGCYCISLSRYLFEGEPLSVTGILEFDPEMQTDHIATGTLQFQKGKSSFTCSTQLFPYQRVNLIGATGRIEIEVPFNPLPHRKTRILLHSKTGIEEIVFDAADQYTIQVDEFSKSVLNGLDAPYSLEDAISNMRVVEAIVASNKDRTWKAIK